MKFKNLVVTTHSGATLNPPALVKLTPAQAKRRAHAIRETETKGVFEVLSTIGFKQGEEIAVDPSTVSKAQFSELEPAESADAEEVVKDVKEKKAEADKTTAKRNNAAGKKATKKAAPKSGKKA